MSIHEIAPAKEHPFPTLANILFITWGCSLLWGGGLVFSGWAFYVAMWGGWWSSDGGPVWETPLVITLILGLVATLSSPILLRATITRNWQQSIKAGLGSFLAGILTFLVVWIGNNIFYEWAHSWSGYFNYSLLLERAIDLSSLLLISLTACSTIITLTLLTKTHQYQNFELIAGVVIGIGLSMISGMMLRTSLLTDDDIFHFIWQIPPLVWISTAYFPELLAGRSRWTDLPVWAFLVLISFGLPFVVVPLLSLISM
ncbi:MAG: hypothetical protein QMD04_04145 [Anaerolineales bacterium]|nr:hypothetical protein [Anaerolineales bacterium]